MAAIVMIRGILKEMRMMTSNVESKAVFSWRLVPVYNEIADEFRRMKDSKDQEEVETLKSIGEAYLNYLQALRKGKELAVLYKGHGERSIEASAASVGLSLPKVYKE